VAVPKRNQIVSNIFNEFRYELADDNIIEYIASEWARTHRVIGSRLHAVTHVCSKCDFSKRLADTIARKIHLPVVDCISLKPKRQIYREYCQTYHIPKEWVNDPNPPARMDLRWANLCGVHRFNIDSIKIKSVDRILAIDDDYDYGPTSTTISAKFRQLDTDVFWAFGIRRMKKCERKKQFIN